MSDQKPIGPVEALKLALSKEVEAKDFYERMSRQSKLTADIFQFLANEEEKHRLLIENKIEDLTRP